MEQTENHKGNKITSMNKNKIQYFKKYWTQPKQC